MAKAPEILTPRRTGKTLERRFLPYQRDWINDEAPRKLGEKARRTGFTFCEAYDAVSRRFRPTQPRDSDYWFSSADESSAEEFIEYSRFFSQDLFGKIADYYVDGVEDESTGKTSKAFCIRCPNGKRIIGLTSNPRRFRSKGGDVCLDEFGYHADPRAMYKAASPVTRWGGTMRIFSTHNGQGSEFNKLVQRCHRLLSLMGHDPKRPPRGLAYTLLAEQARLNKLTPIFSFHRVTIEDAVAAGLVEKINDTKGTDWSRAAFLQDCRDECLDADGYNEEYGCEPASDANAWLPYSLIESCYAVECPAEDAELTGYTGGPAYVGVDVARKRDLTVIWVLEQIGDVHWTRRLIKLADMKLPQQERVLAGILRSVKLVRCCIDKTGLGLGLFEHTEETFGEHLIEGIDFTPGNKTALATDIKRAFEDRGVRIPAGDDVLREDLHRVRKIVTSTDQVRFDATRDEDGHADRFWACALALHAGSTAKVGNPLLGAAVQREVGSPYG